MLNNFAVLVHGRLGVVWLQTRVVLKPWKWICGQAKHIVNCVERRQQTSAQSPRVGRCTVLPQLDLDRPSSMKELRMAGLCDTR